MEKSKKELDIIQDQLRTGHAKEAINKMDKQAKQALRELEQQLVDLFYQVLGFQPSRSQRAKHGGFKRLKDGGALMYWRGEAIIKLEPIEYKIVSIHFKGQDDKIRFQQNYEILKDDPEGYKAKNPKDNYVYNRYDFHADDPDDDQHPSIIMP